MPLAKEEDIFLLNCFREYFFLSASFHSGLWCNHGPLPSSLSCISIILPSKFYRIISILIQTNCRLRLSIYQLKFLKQGWFFITVKSFVHIYAAKCKLVEWWSSVVAYLLN